MFLASYFSFFTVRISPECVCDFTGIYTWWWLLLMFVPVVNVVIGIIVLLDLAKVFGKSSGFGVGLIFLAFIFIPILAFGDAQYLGPIAGQAVGYQPPTTGN